MILESRYYCIHVAIFQISHQPVVGFLHRGRPIILSQNIIAARLQIFNRGPIDFFRFMPRRHHHLTENYWPHRRHYFHHFVADAYVRPAIFSFARAQLMIVRRPI